MDKIIVLEDCLTSKNIDRLYRFYSRASIWRGYTECNELLPHAANYDMEHVYEYDKNVSNRDKERFLVGEIQRVFYYFDIENTNGNYPFPTPRIFDNNFYQPLAQSESDFFKGMEFYPSSDRDLLQVLSFVQHKHQGTSLIDFSENPFKALFFAIGKEPSKDSHLLGINTTLLTTYKNNGFHIYKPTYFLNKRIQHQNGLFLYEKIPLTEGVPKDAKYKNVLCVLQDISSIRRLETKNLSYCDSPEDFDCLYCHLTIPSSAKPELSAILKSMGITKEYLLDC
ncbi:MAG: FRG domain-containing protein [Spirochaetaceae bacterium]|jgi:hypothetical protein|nr:FRG domain-containing protein [Spirochaetaceae bacterium]